MIFFTTHVTIFRRNHERTDRGRGTPARVEGTTIRLPVGTDVQVGDLLDHQSSDDEPQRMVVIDAVHPHMLGARKNDDHIELTCAPLERVQASRAMAPALHPAMGGAVSLLEDGRMAEAICEALRLVEERVESLVPSDDSGHVLMESVFGSTPPKLNITTTTGGQAAADEREGFRHLFVGAMLGLRRPHAAGAAVPDGLDEAMEYLAVASMLMRRLDRAARRLG
jgi:uncharacterized protein (TIGR02391 family)